MISFESAWATLSSFAERRIPNCYDCRFALWPRFDPVSVHCILPGRGVSACKIQERQLQTDARQYRQSKYKFGII
jgi:hypothetical protein